MISRSLTQHNMNQIKPYRFLSLIIFIFLFFVYLSCKKEEANTPPVASFSITPENGSTDTIFTLDASGCYDKEDETDLLQVRWDFETDGTWDSLFSTAKTVKHQFIVEGTYTISLEVIDSKDVMTSVSKQLNVPLAYYPPANPSAPIPHDNAINQDLTITLSWTCSDPDGDSLVYDIYFDTESPPTLFETGWSYLAVWSDLPGWNEIKFETNILNVETKYYWKIVARDNNENITEGPVWQFETTGGTFTDARDGHEYDYVNIGTQTWMAENLAWLPSVSDPVNGSFSVPYYYVYDYVGTNVLEAIATDNYKTYGVLYNWSAAETACPSGWHFPGDEEWTELINYLGGEDVAGGKLKEKGTSHWITPNSGATNESNFSALPGGSIRTLGTLSGIGNYTSFWSYPGTGPTVKNTFVLTNTSTEFIRSNAHTRRGLSVRCLKNE